MTEIEKPTCSMEDVVEWYNVSEQLAALKDREAALRKKVFDGCFHNPVEGTNSYPLPDNWVLKANYKLNRTIDMEAVSTMAAELRESGINLETVIKYKPEVATTEYKKLNDDQRKLFDNCLVIKPGTPSLEIVLPKRTSKSTPPIPPP